MPRGLDSRHDGRRKVGRFAQYLGPKKSEWAGLLEEPPSSNTPNDWADPKGMPRPILGKYKWTE